MWSTHTHTSWCVRIAYLSVFIFPSAWLQLRAHDDIFIEFAIKRVIYIVTAIAAAAAFVFLFF